MTVHALPRRIGGDIPLSIAAIEAALSREDKALLVLTQKNVDVLTPKPDDLFRVGTLATITPIGKMKDMMQIVIQGIERAEVVCFDRLAPPFEASVLPLPFPAESGVEIEALQREILDLAGRYFELGHPEVKVAFPTYLGPGDDIFQLAFPLTQLLVHDYSKAQEALEAPTRLAALTVLHALLEKEILVLTLRHKIAEEAEVRIKREQHDYILHQQMQVIQKELGEKGSAEEQLAELRKKLAELTLPEEVRRETERELARLEHAAPTSPDFQINLNHVQLVLELPWDSATVDRLDVGNARSVLDEDHFGLKDVKERIVEHLAMMKLNPKAKAPILCFVGPPGVGKTSLGQSIARAMGRRFEHFSLGGLHDEAELRGHRRTYIGALPGRIIQAVRRAGVKNPLIMLDEVDKLGQDFRGDPAAALMEILDPAQNCAFRDNYLDLPFDLSKVFFITTANSVDTIPRPLQDRMETLRLSGYSDEEKLEIARRYLLPRQHDAPGSDGSFCRVKTNQNSANCPSRWRRKWNSFSWSGFRRLCPSPCRDSPAADALREPGHSWACGSTAPCTAHRSSSAAKTSAPRGSPRPSVLQRGRQPRNVGDREHPGQQQQIEGGD